MPNLLRLLYASTAAPDLTPSDLTDILAEARAHNARVGLTGVLCYSHGHFAQVLEGPEAAVVEIYVKLLHDRRHGELVLISISPTDRRLYEGWYMASIPEARFSFGIDELLALRSSAGEGFDALALMDRWVALL